MSRFPLLAAAITLLLYLFVATQPPAPASGPTLHVRGNQLFFRDAEVRAEELTDKLRGTSVMRLVASPHTPPERIAQVLKAAVAAGVTSVRFSPP